MDRLKAGVVAALRAHFPAHAFSTEKLAVIHRGRFANAILFRYRDDDYDLVIKDYSHSPLIIRQSAGRLFIAREAKALRRLRGLPGIAKHSYRLNERMLAYSYIGGTPLSVLKQRRRRLPPSFFRDMERMIRQMHRRGVAHLDLRNLGNVLCGDDGRPYFLDFQSHLNLARAPRRLQPLLRGTDLSGVYKFWLELCDQPLPECKQRFLTSFNKVRKLWVFRGYPLLRGRRKRRDTSPSLANAEQQLRPQQQIAVETDEQAEYSGYYARLLEVPATGRTHVAGTGRCLCGYGLDQTTHRGSRPHRVRAISPAAAVDDCLSRARSP